MSFREVFLFSQALEGITLSMVCLVSSINLFAYLLICLFIFVLFDCFITVSYFLIYYLPCKLLVIFVL